MGVLNEIPRRPDPHDPTLNKISPERVWSDNLTLFSNVWEHIVKAYTSTNLSRESDKLIAIGALAKVISLRTGDRYLAGL